MTPLCGVCFTRGTQVATESTTSAKPVKPKARGLFRAAVNAVIQPEIPTGQAQETLTPWWPPRQFRKSAIVLACEVRPVTLDEAEITYIQPND